ncbi:MAG: HD family phosphohydrolase [Blastocatellia bacterium]
MAEQQITRLLDYILPRFRTPVIFATLCLLTAILIAPSLYLLFTEGGGVPFLELGLPEIAGLMALCAAIYFALSRAVERMPTGTVRCDTAFHIACLTILGQLILIRGGLLIAGVVLESPGVRQFNDPLAAQFAIPFATCGMLLSLLVSSHLALIVSLIAALFAGLMSPDGMPVALFSLVSSIIAIYKAEHYRTRNTISRTILGLGLINMITGIAVLLVAHRTMTPALIGQAIFMSLLGALLTAGIASVMTPVYESAFNVLTDLKLLELSSADHPLLRQLAIRAPGTNHHSFVVGVLAEGAAKAIGANALLARVGCMFHDIGKMAAPNMYIENQQAGENPHDKVQPVDSVRIITGHVRRGIKLGTEAGLPPQILDFIPQHHGTRALMYFYHRAKSQAEARGETVNIEEFRYPGPKPQSREAAILMLADGAEASVRSLDEPTPENIQLILDRIIQSVINDGQFDECHLTLKEITKIRASLISTLVGIYHHRISYPGFNPPARNGVNSHAPTPPAASEAVPAPSPVDDDGHEDDSDNSPPQQFRASGNL